MIKKTIIDTVTVYSEDEYSCILEIASSEENDNSSQTNLGKSEVLELATTLLDIYKQMK